MNFGKALKGLGGAQSPFGRMNSQQKLQALGAAFSGDQKMLGELMGGLGPVQGAASPVLNSVGEDISAAFGGVGTEIAGGSGLLPALGRRLGFGRKGR